MELPEDAPTGHRLADYLGLDDHILDIDLTPNRADCLSVRGLARELAALTGVAVEPPSIAEKAAVHQDSLPIELLEPADCPRYVGRIIRGVDVSARTPLWMVEALRRGGIRSLGPIVDVTNYVLLELGQPMHAFDLDRISGGIRVRRASAGERLTLLDDRTVELDEDMLVIADHDGPVALGGIMGGLDSAVGSSTRDILLESAWFNPAAITGRSRRLGLATESAHRFERGVDPDLQRLAADRASALILEIAGGEPGPLMDTVEARQLPVNRPVELRLGRLNRLLGTRLEIDEVAGLLGALGMTVGRDEAGQKLSVEAPSARRDIEIEVDLIEEVARLYGYDRLPTRAPGGGLKAEVPSETRLSERELRRQLASRGFQEIMTWSFVAEADLEQLDLLDGVQSLANPLSRDMAVLRTSLLPGLLTTAGMNLRRQHDTFRLFEVGTCFSVRADGFAESRRLGVLLTGRAADEHFSAKPRAVDFFDLKGEIEYLLALNAVVGKVEFQRAEHAWLHPGQASSWTINGRVAGWLGQMHPTLVDQLDWHQTAFVGELDLAALDHRALPAFRAGSRYPSLRRDLSLVVDEDVPAAALVEEIRARVGERLENCVIFDQYVGPGVEKGFKSLSIGLIIRDVSRTLKEEEVEALIGEVVAGLEDRHNARLRG
jgi:phenylalanyl-tRNA synthetase beta chain